ncbi:hypothetical protein B0H67DRAFT_118247 [Lasiosphaeris hirsuta]|uniref:DUF8040 domain-containing protein n=1 Tax=Lasiosphaeris hirsuta TaxID=260670 RepID=A0AA40E4M6_9PEZI|nr:hypothetical protein B0H67DRAFT_118247 [Lasiosphaeris hirsuta]
MPPSVQQQQTTNIAFAAAAVTATRFLFRGRNLHHMRPGLCAGAEGEGRDTIYLGGPRHARKIVETLLNGSNTQFRDLFRMDKFTFKVLIQWFQWHTRLRATRYQTVEEKALVPLYIFSHAEGRRVTVKHRIADYGSTTTVSPSSSAIAPAIGIRSSDCTQLEAISTATTPTIQLSSTLFLLTSGA